ncbi:MAG: insulinase family protein, partial [Bacteroidales bacterium]|nr:insulinase family protein [Bacteroidales bacterium]
MTHLNRKIQPGILSISEFQLLKPDKQKLSNGTPVFIINAGTQDLVKLEWVFNAGSWFEQKPLVSRFTHKMLKEGTPNYSSAFIAEKLDYYGAYLETFSNHDHVIISLYILNKHLDKILPVIEEIIKYPSFPENELAIIKQREKQKFIV